jgi:1-deoxy-D-xylulose-5-phosphate synthase
VGIAEEHAVTFASALAANKMKPYFAVYSSFLQRGYDNVIHDAALQKLPIKLLVDRAGLNASDGATHHGIFDVAFLSHIPEMTIFTPITNAALRRALHEANELDGPSAIRYPNGVENERVVAEFYSKGETGALGAVSNFETCDSPEAVIVTHGRIVKEAVAAADMLNAEGVSVGIALLEMLKPYKDAAENISALISNETRGVLFLEEEIRSGGMGMNLIDIMRSSFEEKCIKYDTLAIDDSFVSHVQSGQSIYEAAGIDKNAICEKIKKMI